MWLAFILILLALTERLVFDLGPNVELVTMATVVASMYLPWRVRFLVPLVIMAISDWYLGIGTISWFTWSGFLMIGWLPGLIGRLTRDNWIKGVGAGCFGALWFFLWTNLGVWLTDSWGMYNRDLSGLMQCYVNGLPFFKVNMMSSLTFVPLGLGVMEILRNKGGFFRGFRFDLTN